MNNCEHGFTSTEINVNNNEKNEYFLTKNTICNICSKTIEDYHFRIMGVKYFQLLEENMKELAIDEKVYNDQLKRSNDLWNNQSTLKVNKNADLKKVGSSLNKKKERNK
ncbi:hypothetical protein [Spiroplasma tabanidicola]|uniref:Uncharacterized protein n=1 Tax=Spiroplasma tabanidicola TaxID=324079 RepID=A0A6I6CB98_9MOLU|nr:hypothetical protein [Spiroplasma tabanidicola]QGS51448.1 hypothetical protein STABA_v1c00810 [Spiroplasma tabanidicola]